MTSTNKALQLYFGKLANVRITAVNKIGKSETSLSIFHSRDDTLIEFGDKSPWTDIYSIDQTKDVHVKQINVKQRDNKFELTGIQLIWSNGD